MFPVAPGLTSQAGDHNALGDAASSEDDMGDFSFEQEFVEDR